MEAIYLTKRSSGSREHPVEGEIIEERHTRSEIIHHAEEILAQ